MYPPFLHYAAVYSAPHAAALLLERGAPADSWHDGRSALTLAAANRGLPFDIGETVGEVVFEGRTLAAFLEHTRTTSRKIEAWADGAGRRLGPSLARSGWTYADADSWERTARDLVRHAALVHLLTAQADLEGRDEWGRTPLFYAAASGNAVAVRQLLEAGADPNAADAAGVTPLMTAADQATTDETDWLSATIVAALLAAGADSDARDLAGRRAADYVGDRALTAATKRSRLSVPESGPFPTSETLGVVQLAQEGGSAAAFELDARRRWYADNARRLPTAAPDDRADIGDGPGQPPYPDDPAPDAVATLPTGDDPLVVRCNAVNETDLTVEVTLQRTAHAGYGRVLDVYSATWDLGTSQVANSVWSQCLEEVRGELRRQPVDGPHRDALYDLEGDPERWPRRTAHVRVDGRPRPGRPNG